MEIDFQKIKDFKKRKIYQQMWEKNSFSYFQDKIAQTIWNGGVSENSYSFVMTGEKERDLREVFQIWKPDIFHSQFVYVTGIFQFSQLRRGVKNPIAYLHTHYCRNAVESDEQRIAIERFS